MTPAMVQNPRAGAEENMSKLVGALLLELVDDVPDKTAFESVRADLLAASKVYESGKKKDLALRFYLAVRTLLHEVERMEKMEKSAEARPGPDAPQSFSHNEQGTG